MTTSFIDVRHLVKRYGEKLVLDDFDLAVDAGDTCVIMGGSGSGKSTFARLLVGLEEPDSGAIWVDGVDIVGLRGRALDKVRKKFSVVFQNYALLDSMSVFDNVAFPLREELHASEKEVKERVMRVLSELDVADASKKLPAELSGGMAKRVSIARAIVTEPEILVYDEPTTGLDPVKARVVDRLIERMRDRYAVTSIVITHDMVTAYEVADRVVLLAHGKAVAQGPPEEPVFVARCRDRAVCHLERNRPITPGAAEAARKAFAFVQAIRVIGDNRARATRARPGNECTYVAEADAAPRADRRRPARRGATHTRQE